MYYVSSVARASTEAKYHRPRTNPCTGEYNKIEIFKMAARRFVEVSDKEISEIRMNSDQKNTKKLVQKY
jgi:hypothetical protein